MNSSSDDILADRRFAWAKALAEEGLHEAAADLLGQVIARVPHWAPAWAAMAEALERDGRAEAAAAAWTRLATLDPGDRFGASLRVARGAGLTPPAMADTYVRALFDDYAQRFEHHLVATLGYRGPTMLVEALDRALPGRRFARALDLGCGTGLMGRALAGRGLAIDGVDLSPAMVDLARSTGLYAALAVGPLLDSLAETPEATYDLVTAADVMVYVGDLGPTLAGIRRALVPGGVLAFTVQTPTTPPEGSRSDEGAYVLGPDLRFAHAPAHVAAALAAAGLRARLVEEAATRTERGAAVPGLVVLATTT